jgi:hypothetical protein
MVYAYLAPDFRKHISRELWYIFFVWSFSVMRFIRPMLKHLMSVRPSVRFLQSATPLWKITILRKKIISFPILGGGPPWSAPDLGVAGCRTILLPHHPAFNEKSKNHCGQLQWSVKIISTKWFMHISHLISVNIFLENFDTFLFVWSFSVMKSILGGTPWIRPWFRSCGLQNHPPTPPPGLQWKI